MNLKRTDGTSFYLSPDSIVSTLENIVTAFVPASSFTGVASWTASFYVPGPSFTPIVPATYYFASPGWSNIVPALDPKKRTIVFVHGILSDIKDSFKPGCAASIQVAGGYDQAVGIDYDWTVPPSSAGPDVGKRIDALGLTEVDIIAHSYGTIVALQAFPNMRTSVRNMVLLAGPLPNHGTPLAAFPAQLRRAGLELYNRGVAHMDPGSVDRAFRNKMLDAIKPDSLALQQIEAAIVRRGRAVPRFIEAGGFKPLIIGDPAIPPIFLGDFYDGVIPLRSATNDDFAAAPQNFSTMSFNDDHGTIVCDPDVHKFFGSKLDRTPPSPGASASPSPGPSTSPSPGPSTSPSASPSASPSPGPSTSPSPVPSDTPGAISEYPIPLNNTGNLSDNRPNGITAGRDFALWFTFGSSAVPATIGRMTAAGAFSKYPLPTGETQPWGIVAGTDGALWFTEVTTNKIGRISTSGQLLQEFTIPSAASLPYGLVFGSDAALWFIECRAGANKIGRMTTTGQFQEFAVNAGINGTPEKITAGTGTLWFTESDAGRIGVINTDGSGYHDYSIGNGAVGHGIAFGPDGALWFTARDFATIGRLTTSGQYTPYPLGFNGHPQEIVSGPDNSLWFTLNEAMVAKITVAGEASPYSVLQSQSHPFAITVGPDAALWFTDDGGQIKQIGRAATSVSHRLTGVSNTRQRRP